MDLSLFQNRALCRLRAATYVRTSGFNPRGLEQQSREVFSFSERQNLEIICSFADSGRTCEHAPNSGLAEFIQLVENGMVNVDCLVVASLTRLCRNSDVLSDLNNRLRANGVCILAVTIHS